MNFLPIDIIIGEGLHARHNGGFIFAYLSYIDILSAIRAGGAFMTAANRILAPIRAILTKTPRKRDIITQLAEKHASDFISYYYLSWASYDLLSWIPLFNRACSYADIDALNAIEQLNIIETPVTTNTDIEKSHMFARGIAKTLSAVVPLEQKINVLKWHLSHNYALHPFSDLPDYIRHANLHDMRNIIRIVGPADIIVEIFRIAGDLGNIEILVNLTGYFSLTNYIDCKNVKMWNTYKRTSCNPPEKIFKVLIESIVKNNHEHIFNAFYFEEIVNFEEYIVKAVLKCGKPNALRFIDITNIPKFEESICDLPNVNLVIKKMKAKHIINAEREFIALLLQHYHTIVYKNNNDAQTMYMVKKLCRLVREHRSDCEQLLTLEQRP